MKITILLVISALLPSLMFAQYPPCAPQDVTQIANTTCAIGNVVFRFGDLVVSGTSGPIPNPPPGMSTFTPDPQGNGFTLSGPSLSGPSPFILSQDIQIRNSVIFPNPDVPNSGLISGIAAHLVSPAIVGGFGTEYVDFFATAQGEAADHFCQPDPINCLPGSAPPATPVVSFSAPVTGLHSGVTFEIYAENDNPTSSSNVVSFNAAHFEVLLVPTGPSAPTNLQATQANLGGFDIQLTWDYGTDSIDGFEFERQTPSQSQTGTWSTPPTLVPLSKCTPVTTGLTCSYLDSASTIFGTYNYRMRAYKGTNQSLNSNEDQAFQIQPTFLNGITIQIKFAPDPSMSLSQAATALGYDHFNWVSVVEHQPACYASAPFHDYFGNALFPRHLDPPLGGYKEYGARQGQVDPTTGKPYDQPWESDDLPYYWDEQRFWYQNPSIALNPDYYIFSPFALAPLGVAGIFVDGPQNPCMEDTTTVNQTDPARYMGFSTTLVPKSGVFAALKDCK